VKSDSQVSFLAMHKSASFLARKVFNKIQYENYLQACHRLKNTIIDKMLTIYIRNLDTNKER